jgi:hypothetical protein
MVLTIGSGKALTPPVIYWLIFVGFSSAMFA